MKFSKLLDFYKHDLTTTITKRSQQSFCPVEKSKAYYTRGVKAFKLPFVNYGSKLKVEMHYIKGIKNLKKGMCGIQKAIVKRNKCSYFLVVIEKNI